MFLPFLLKYGMLAGGLIASVITVHHAFEAWKSGLVSVAIVEQQELAHKKELELRDTQLGLLSEANENFRKEVEWARDYREKRDRLIEDLKEKSPDKVQECLDLPVDRAFLL